VAHEWGLEDERLHPRNPASGEWARRISASAVWGKLQGETVTDNKWGRGLNGTKRVTVGHLAENIGSLAGELEVYDQPAQIWHPLEVARPSPQGGGRVQLGARGASTRGKLTVNGSITRSPEERVFVRPVARP
jgi:hypothetical protein